MFFSPQKSAAPSTPSVAASPAISAAQAAADAAAEDGGADSDDASVSTMDSVDGKALDDLEVSGLFDQGFRVLFFWQCDVFGDGVVFLLVLQRVSWRVARVTMHVRLLTREKTPSRS